MAFGVGLVIGACSSSGPPASTATTDPTTPPGAEGDAGAGDPSRDSGAVGGGIAARALSWLEGDFDSKAQAKRDPSYFEISLRACRVDAPDFGRDVLYVEQARVGSAPYRQRLYVVEALDATTARSRVLEPKDASALVGYCTASSRAPLRLVDFVDRVGCVVELRWVNDRFVGHTPDAQWNGSTFVDDPSGQRCESSLNGASYATTSVEVERGRLVSWDRGFDDRGKQVWGATKGGYEFERRTPLREP
ncbi:MAG: chromophore lyase CpcT/CpeT [Deltaproteobacteria bacterium]|nr:chromophore lyase CpcT/CpeT [Deltaproteobacteria bacterium]